MDLFSVLLQPLILISGVALLIVSTSARMSQLESNAGPASDDSARRNHRLRWFRRAIAAFYMSIALLALASLTGATLHGWVEDVTGAVLVLTCLAIVALLWGVISLMAEMRSWAPLSDDG